MAFSALKSRLKTALVGSPLRHLAMPIHRGLTAFELSGVRLSDELRARSSLRGGRARVTAIVKTFERPRELARLLRSAELWFPGLNIVVADDSAHPVSSPRVSTLRLPFDVGVSAGRQAALAEVETEYTWVLDDDFVLYSGTRLERVLAQLDAHRELDLIGGPVIDLPLLLKRSAAKSPIYPTAAAPLIPLGTRIGSAIVRDKVPNFFVARTERLRLVGWDPALKRLDHADFFTRARGVLVTAYDDEFRCLHAQTPFDRAYMERRNDLDGDEEILRRRYGLEPRDR